MSIVVNVNGESINYPQTGDSNWGDEATDFAVQTSSALAKVGLSTGTTVDLPGTLDVTGNTTLDANLSVGGNASVTGIVNVDAGTFYVDPVNNRVGINKTSPAQALDVVGNSAISGNETIGGTLGVTGDVSINTNKFIITATSGNTTIAGTLGVTSDITTSGILTASNSTNVTTAPPITFTGDTNTGIGHSASDTLDYVTGGVSRARINSTGQQSSVVPDLSGSNTTLYNEYKCRAWVNFNGTGTVAIRSSGNVSSITDNGTGDYTVNFTTAMPDANYSVQITTGLAFDTAYLYGNYYTTPTSTSSVRLSTWGNSPSRIDIDNISVAVFR